MKISFFADDPKYSQLACNGGTRSVILSSEVLRGLGHKVSIVAHKDRFSWFSHVPPVKSIPKNTEVLIAVTVYDIKHILKYREKHPNVKLCYYSRPWESWNSSEEKCMRTMFKFHRKGGTILTNSGWQHNWLNMHKINNHLIYSGQDVGVEFEKPDYEDDQFFKMVIGCQYSSKPRKGWKEFKRIVEILGTDQYDYVAFGSEKCKDKFLSTYLRNPERSKLNDLYSQMDVFFIGNQLEGFLNVGAEAAISGALLVCNNNPRCGAHDYCNEDTAHMYNAQYLLCKDTTKIPNQINEILNIFEHLDFSKVEKCQAIIREKIGTRLKNMKKMVEVLR